MNKTNRLLTLRINYLRRQINLKNFIILLIIIYLLFRYFTSPPIDNSARVRDIRSCYDVCSGEYQKCSLHCSNQLNNCRKNHLDKHIGYENKCHGHIKLTCSKPCSNNNELCRNNCRAKYNYHSSLRLVPNSCSRKTFLNSYSIHQHFDIIN
jgi:hypothetical protein